MEQVSRYVDQLAQGILAMSTQEQMGLLGLSIAAVGVVMFVAALLLNFGRKGKVGEMTMAPPPVQLKQSHKGLLVDILTEEIEDRVLFKKLNRKTARLLYGAIGRALDIPELLPAADLKKVIKSRRAYAQALNGKSPKLPVIPGDKPIQELKPNVYRTRSKEAAGKFFKQVKVPM